MSDAAEYPRQLYHPDGRTVRVDSVDHEHQLTREGWGRQASAAHQARLPVFGAAEDPTAALLRDVLESVLDERGLGRSREERQKQRAASKEPEKDRKR